MGFVLGMLLVKFKSIKALECKEYEVPNCCWCFLPLQSLALGTSLLTQNTEKFPFPEDIVWHNPGFFSITVPYEHTRDFYYSGHTGTLTIISLEFWTLGRKPICAICIVSLMYMINMLTITRIHYSIDVIGAFIFAPFWYFFVQKHLVKADYMFSSLFYLFRMAYKKCRGISYYDYGS